MGEVQLVNWGKLPLQKRKGKGAQIDPVNLPVIVTGDLSVSQFNMSQKSL